eukprot:scaffold6857_cov125-Isochrysis_galbana.AAC.6
MRDELGGGGEQPRPFDQGMARSCQAKHPSQQSSIGNTDWGGVPPTGNRDWGGEPHMANRDTGGGPPTPNAPIVKHNPTKKHVQYCPLVRASRLGVRLLR